MELRLPPGRIESQFQAASRAFEGVVGREWVLASDRGRTRRILEVHPGLGYCVLGPGVPDPGHRHPDSLADLRASGADLRCGDFDEPLLRFMGPGFRRDDACFLEH